MVASHCETGFMQLVEDRPGEFDAWIATKRTPTSWRERADVDWWAASLARQHETELYANRQISGVLAWIQRHGANGLLDRIDSRTSKTFRVQKVFSIMLGRYLAHFSDGPDPDRRAAWGAWPQVLRLLDSQPVRATDANPIASLFTRLSKDTPQLRPPADDSMRAIHLGPACLTVHCSYGAFRARTEARTL